MDREVNEKLSSSMKVLLIPRAQSFDVRYRMAGNIVDVEIPVSREGALRITIIRTSARARARICACIYSAPSHIVVHQFRGSGRLRGDRKTDS